MFNTEQIKLNLFSFYKLLNLNSKPLYSFQLIGLTFIGLGSWILLSLKDYEDFLENQIISAPIILITTGAVIVVVSFFGCYGAWRESRCLLKTVSESLSTEKLYYLIKIVSFQPVCL